MTQFGVICLLAVAALLIFYVLVFTYERRLFSEQHKSKSFLALILFNVLVDIVALSVSAPLAILYLLAFGLFVSEFIFIFHRGVIHSFLVGGIFIYTLLCLHGVIIPLMALLLGMNMYTLVRDPCLYGLSIFWALTVCDAALLVFRKLVTVERLTMLLRCRSQARLVCTSMCLLLAYLLLETYIYYYDFPQIWTSLFHMLTSLVAQASLYVVLWYSIDISSYIEYELKTRQVEKQLQRQVVHYQQYTKYISSLRAFKHDYKRMAETARHLVDIGAQEKALRLLSQMNEEMERSLQYVQYSNHVVVDAILQECANRCKEKGISFSAVVNLPESLGLSDLELCRIFGNLVDNAFEACEQVQEGQRFIRIESGVNGDWVTVKLSNSFAGTILMADGLPVTRKSDQPEHGIGLVSAKQIVESTGGFLQIDVDSDRHIFVVNLHLCN